MKLKNFFTLSFILILLSSSAFSQAIGFSEGLKKAKSENKRVIVDVYTDWCSWCKKMDKEAYANSEIKKIIDEHFVLVKLDAEGTEKITYSGKDYPSSELAIYFQVTGYPTTVFLESDGKIIEYKYDNFKMVNLPGYFPAAEFKKVLEYFRDGRYKDTDMSTVI